MKKRKKLVLILLIIIVASFAVIMGYQSYQDSHAHTVILNNKGQKIALVKNNHHKLGH